MGIRENIIKLRKQQGITQEELAKIAGVSRGAVSQWEGGFSEPRMGAIQRIADHFGLRKSNIIEDGGMDSATSSRPLPPGAMPVRGSSATVPVRVLGHTHAGGPMDEEESDYEIEVPESVARAHPSAFALRVEGDCMDRRFPDGCHVLVDPDARPANGCAAVVETAPGESVLRVWMRGAQTLMLAADSHAEHDDIVLSYADGPVTVVGVVVWFQASAMLA